MKLLPLLLLLTLPQLLDYIYPLNLDVQYAIIPAIIAGAAAIGSAAWGASSNKKANSQNAATNQMNNDFNAAEAQKQRDFDLQMWEKNNEYNTPENQRKRMQAGGFNPYMSDIQAGTASGGSTGAHATAASPIANQAYKPDLGNLATAMTSAQLQMSQKKNLDIQNLHQTDLIRANINKTIGDTDWRNSSPEARKYNQAIGLQAAQLQMKTLEEQWNNQIYSNDLLKATKAVTLLDAESKNILNKYLDEQQLSDLNLKAAHYEQKVLDGQVTRQQVKNMIADEILTYARAKGQRINNHVAESTAESLISANNAANDYSTAYDSPRLKWAKQDAMSDTKANRWQNEMTGSLLKQTKFNEKVQGWREALNSTNMIMQGVGNAVGTYDRYQTGKSYRRNSSRSRDYDDTRYTDDEGTTYSSRRYR